MSPAPRAATTAAVLACTDAERRLARAAAARLRSSGRAVRTPTLWVRPAWEPVLALLAAAGVIASVLSVDRPAPGLVLAGAALALAVAETTPFPLLRRLVTYARATQDVVAAAPARRAVTLVLATATDAPRGGVLHRARVPIRAVTIAALAAVAAFAGARVAFDAGGTLLGAAQLVPSAVLVLAVGGLADAAVAGPAPRGGGAVDAVLAATEAIDAARPARVGVEVVLAGAWPLGLHARLRRDRRRPEAVAFVLVRDGRALVHRTAHPTLRAAAERAGAARARGAPRTGRRRPTLTMDGPPDALARALVRLASELDAELAVGAARQPASGERSAKSVK